jgi:hypothetical protein
MAEIESSAWKIFISHNFSKQFHADQYMLDEGIFVEGRRDGP